MAKPKTARKRERAQASTEQPQAAAQGFAAAGAVLTDLARSGIERFVAAEKTMLDFAAQQNTLAIGALKQAWGPTSGPGLNALASFAQLGGQQLLAVQKTMLDLAVQQNE